MSEIIKNTEIIEEIQPKGYYKVVNEYYKEVDDIKMIDGVETVVGKKKIVTGRDVEWVWTDEEELKKQQEFEELITLEKWFNEIYDTQVKQYNRCQRLGIEYDNKYGTIIQLDEQAVINAKRINELRNSLAFLYITKNKGE